ncbi:MAG: hypothetical protein ACREMQ_12815 [Longimicrobiales bacterium]
MQTVIQVSCRRERGTSLREAIESDERIEKFGMSVSTRRVPGRNPGWAKIHSLAGYPGAINIRWDAATSTLLARVVTRQRQPATELIGMFVAYLLKNHSTKIRAITILP